MKSEKEIRAAIRKLSKAGFAQAAVNPSIIASYGYKTERAISYCIEMDKEWNRKKRLPKEKCYYFHNGIFFTSEDNLDELDIILISKGIDMSNEELRQQERAKVFREIHPQEGIAIDMGHEALDKKHWEEWDQLILSIRDMSGWMGIAASLEIIKILNTMRGFTRAKNVFYRQGHSCMSASLTRAIIIRFCARGKEFCDWMDK